MDIKAPTFPESITEGTVAQWHKKPGEPVSRDDLLADIETDKVVIEVVAPDDGTLLEVLKDEGDIVESEEVIAHFEAGEGKAPAADKGDGPEDKAEDKEPAEAQAATPDDSSEPVSDADKIASPAARKVAAESGISIDTITGTGRDGRITKEDVAKAVAQMPAGQSRSTPVQAKPSTAGMDDSLLGLDTDGERVERRVPMTRMRASIAKRLVEAQHNAAMLTTFNEVDMSHVIAMRKKYQEQFQKTHNGTRLGFMSFFLRASVEALKRFPSVNASIDGSDIVYHGFYDIGVAVSTEKGLVVPVVRDADALSLAQIEDQINAYGEKARSGKMALEDMAGGTFTISNGGVFGSMMSTPILNPPQTGVLGLHNIQERAVVVDGEIVIRPMMYLALSYDHRLIDGREAVQFLVAIKGMIEDPARILLEL
ncbi:MAG: 2-oxoglutarate dehydrogenase complex dihydrolipoyllysine-residue succinyltransferase [Pseudomonadaceae bacterium]|nr:2-oxoglutarate dehydrogenase complex dihydrolipoyllysine-residue succinyltransferase [Pseudomonadaceae bacterium]